MEEEKLEQQLLKLNKTNNNNLNWIHDAQFNHKVGKKEIVENAIKFLPGKY